MTDGWLMALGIGLSTINIIVIWAIAWRFEHKVEAVVARHTTTLVAGLVTRHEDAMRVAEHARGVVLTMHAAIRNVEVRVDKLEQEMRRADRAP